MEDERDVRKLTEYIHKLRKERDQLKLQLYYLEKRMHEMEKDDARTYQHVPG